jgi:hypothetical protein
VEARGGGRWTEERAGGTVEGIHGAKRNLIGTGVGEIMLQNQGKSGAIRGFDPISANWHVGGLASHGERGNKETRSVRRSRMD